jgi:glycogen debranching enzyme
MKRETIMKKLISPLAFVLPGFAALLLLLASLSASAQPSSTEAANSKALSDLTMSTNSVGPARFVAVHGRRSAVFGYPGNGLEIWCWPFQILDGYHVTFVPEGEASEIPGEQVLRRIEYSPEAVTRIYAGPDFVVREKLFVPLDKPGAIVSFAVEGRGHVDIRVRFTPQMNLMWPAAVGGQSFQWNDSASGYVLRDPIDDYTATVSSDEVAAHDGTGNHTIHYSDGLSMLLRPKAGGVDTRRAELFVGMNSVHGKDLSEAVKDLAANERTYEQDAVKHYAELMASSLQIHTPDDDANRALAWSEIALDQDWVCNDQLGCGLVAGYGPSRAGRRPQYAWFFAGDGMVAAEGLVASGEYARARAELEFILKYQNRKTGMIWHELSQSAGFLDWENKFPYMFVHVDVTYQFLNTVAQYVQTSGDVGFARQHWDELALAYNYCRSIIDAGTHLPRIPADKEGSNEQDRESDELSLSAAWLDASSAFAQLAQWTSHTQLAAEARQASEAAHASIAARYWDNARQFWISAHTVNGAEVFDERSRPGELITENVFSPEQNDILLKKIASSDFQTDWGARGLSSASHDFDPNAYAKGSIFALGATSLADTFWSAHRPAVAFPIWNAVVPWTQLDSLGHIHEVAAGDLYHQEMESVPEQTWSSAGLITATANGLLGLHVDSIAKELTFAPHMPPEWQRLSVENVRLEDSTLGLDLTAKDQRVAVTVTNHGGTVKVSFAPEIPLGARVLSAECGGRPVKVDPKVDAEVHAEDEHARIQFTAAPGDTRCSIAYDGGVTVIPPRTAPVVGDASKGIKITGVNLRERILTVDADVNAAGPQFVEIRTPWKVLSAESAKISPEGAGLYRVDFNASGQVDQYGYSHRAVTIRFDAR